MIPKDCMFSLLPIADPKAVQKVYDEGGVKEVDLNLGRYLSTSRADDREQETLLERIGRGTLLDLVGEGETRRRIEEAENVNAKLVISLNSRRSGLKSEEFTEIAKSIADDSEEDDVEIVTARGERIKKGRLALKKTVQVDSDAKTVNYNHAWEKMAEYFKELNQAGYLDQ